MVGYHGYHGWLPWLPWLAMLTYSGYVFAIFTLVPIACDPLSFTNSMSASDLVSSTCSLDRDWILVHSRWYLLGIAMATVEVGSSQCDYLLMVGVVTDDGTEAIKH